MKRESILVVIVVLLVNLLSGCGSELEEVSQASNTEETSYIEELSSDYVEESFEDVSMIVEEPENSSTEIEDSLFAVNEQDAIDFYNKIVLRCTTEWTFPLMQFRELFVPKKRYTVWITDISSVLSIYYAEIKDADPRYNSFLDSGGFSKEDDLSELVDNGILQEEDYTWIQSQRLSSFRYYKIETVQKALDYFYGKDVFSALEWVSDEDEEGSYQPYISANGLYFLYMTGIGGPYCRYYYYFDGYELSQDIGTIKVKCLKTTHADGTWLQDVAADRDYKNIEYDGDKNNPLYSTENDVFFRAAKDYAEVTTEDLGTIKISFYKDEQGVHYYDIHYPDKNIFIYQGDVNLKAYNSPSFDDPMAGEGYSPGSYHTIFRIRDGWGELRYRDLVYWVRMDDMVPRENHIIDYPDTDVIDEEDSSEIIEENSSEIVIEESSQETSSEASIESEEDSNWKINEFLDLGPYQPVIEKYIAVKTNNGIEQFEGVDEDLGFSYYGCSILIRSSDQLGYQLIDIDGNGVEELFIGYSGENSNSIFDLYTLVNEKPVHLMTSWERKAIFLLEDNSLFVRGSNGAAYAMRERYCLNENAELELVENLYSTVVENEIQWYHQTINGESMEEEAILTEDAYAIVNEWEKNTRPIDFIVFLSKIE